MPSLYDFSSPYVTVSLTLASGEQIPMWTNAAQAQPSIMQDARLASLAFVTDVTVKTNLGALSEITVNLQPPFRDGIAFLNSDLIEWGRTRISAEFGYSGGTNEGRVSNLVTALMMQPSVSVGQDINITLHGLGSLGLALGERNFVKEKTTRLTLMQYILKGADSKNTRNLTLNDDETKDQPEVRALLNTQLDSYYPSHKSDLDLLNELASACLCWISVRTDQVVLIPRNKRFGGPTKATFSLMDFPGGQIGPNAKLFPILGFSTPNTAIYLPGSLRALVARGVSSSDRKIKEIRIDDTTASSARVGPQGGATAPKPSLDTPGVAENSAGSSIAGDGATYIRTNISDPNAAKLMTAEFEKTRAQFGVEAHVESLGVPDLFPGDVVVLSGLGARLNNTYGVFEVTHSIGSNGYSTRFIAWSNVIGMDPQYGEAPAGKINANEPSVDDKPGDFDVQPSLMNGGTG